MLALELPPDLQSRLEALAVQTGRQPAELAIEAIQEQLDDIEDVVIAEQRLLECDALGEKMVPIEELIERYGLEG